MRVRKGSTGSVEFKPSVLQVMFDVDRLDHCGVGAEFIAIRHGKSLNICRAVRVRVKAVGKGRITTDFAEVYGEGMVKHFHADTGIQVGAVRSHAIRDGVYWSLHAVTPETEVFLEAAEAATAEAARKYEILAFAVEALLASASNVELQAVIYLFQELRK
jgi:hypothetical protein